MKTAVGWLVAHFKKLQSEGEKMSWNQIIQITELTKEMEKEQIIKHSLELAKILISNPIEVSGKTPTELTDSYINKTFKSE
jgi:uncharacterized protein YpuA (DUF1002 family)